MKLKERILEHYEKGFSSSPVEIEKENLQLLIKEDCECSRCAKSVFEMWDFPEFRNDEVLCEECNDELYRSICPCCEESYDVEDESDYFVINEELSKEIGKKAGVYKILSKPFFYGNIVSGFDGFFDSSIKLVAKLNINEYKKIDCGEDCEPVPSGIICQECVDKLLKKENYLTLEGRPCILMKKYEKDFLSYTPEQLKFMRQKLIHNRITCRGIIQSANSSKISARAF